MSLRDYLFYEEPGIALYCGDCLEVLPLLTEPIDLVFTSPPYNLGTSTSGGFPGKKLGHYPEGAGIGARGGGATRTGKWSGGALASGYGRHEDAMPHEEYVAWQGDVLTALWGLLSPDGAIYYNHKPRVLNGVLVAPIDYVPSELRSYVRQEIIWARAGGINFSPAFYVPTHERIVIIARRSFRLRDKGASGVGDVWYIPQAPDPEHPAPFPIKLAAQAIETTTATVILDPFAGSGTALQAAKRLNRRAVGIEIEPRNCEVAVNRLRQRMMWDITP